ncbi:hypothetical protein [Runella sp.]|uniref:hypothetical protein n=1 Tax=Runella sp. TaxID=1960881 RepID=UPI003D134626
MKKPFSLPKESDFLLVVGLPSTVTIFTLLYFHIDSLDALVSFVKQYSTTITIILLVSASGLLTLFGVISKIAQYLDNKNLNKTEPNNPVETFNQETVDKIIGESIALNRIVVSGLNEDQLSEIKSSISEELIKRFKSLGEQEAINKLIFNDLNNTLAENKNSIERLGRNSNVNLIIGFVWSFVSISLIISLLINGKVFTSFLDYLMYYIPRISGVIFFQIFSFFFLRLYKSNLEDIKYFQNELTNLNSKANALRIAHLLNRTEVLDEGLKVLFSTERNFRILKEETMLTIEKAKIENEMDSKLISYYKEFIDKHFSKEEKKVE